jgi:hypothetical protein
MASAEKNYYLTLGITRTAAPDEIRHAYRLLAMKHHPDRNQGDKQSEELFKEIQEAYQVLSDGEKRKNYDNSKFWNFSFSYFQQVRHYFIVYTDVDHVRLNDEFKITFTYTGEGRFFQKPSMQGLFVTSKPFVTFKKIFIDGTEVKETSLEYTVAPMQTGDLIIETATIRIHNEVYHTDPIKIHVSPNTCFYKKGEPAGNHPYKFPMNTTIEAGSETHQVTYHQDHIILIPRSNVARYYHNIGTIIKAGCMIWGFFLFSVEYLNEFAGILCGSLFGGICCHIFYFTVGIKSKFYYSTRFPLVLTYKAKGYEKGKYSGSSYITGNLTSWISDLLT